MTDRWRRMREGRAADRGFTLVELLIALLLFGVLGAISFSSVIAASRSVDSTRRTTALSEEARIALNRMGRELREAKAITAVSAPDPSRSLTFEVDFNGNGTIEPTAVDPEVLTYSYDATNHRIQLTASTAAGVQTLPILASDVYDFSIQYSSRDYRYDTNGDGSTWQEIDAHPDGDQSGTLTTPELAKINSVVISFRVFKDSQAQHYRTQIDLRNRA